MIQFSTRSQILLCVHVHVQTVNVQSLIKIKVVHVRSASCPSGAFVLDSASYIGNFAFFKKIIIEMEKKTFCVEKTKTFSACG